MGRLPLVVLALIFIKVWSTVGTSNLSSATYMCSFIFISEFGTPNILNKNSTPFLVPLDFHIHAVFIINLLQNSISTSFFEYPFVCPENITLLGFA